jgi:putative DNA methylase
LSEFFLAWYEKHLRKLFPEWYIDSKRALAVNNSAGDFRRAMMECYRNLAQNMPDEGFQVVMFTHQDTAVWADLTVILWASGLRVTSAWCISTETDSTLKQGNFVQGTVILILRKRTDNEIAFLDEISHNVEIEVRRQLDTMLALEDNSERNFADADYQLAAYAAALRVLTVQPVDGIDPEREIMRERRRGEVSPVEKVIRNAVKIACDHLVPSSFDGELWKELGGIERFYLKGLEVESHGEYRNGVYQELARGFGAAEYTDLLAGTKANETRLKSASELRNVTRGDFGITLTRQVLNAVFQAIKREDARAGLNWLRTELTDYWGQREKILSILDYLAVLRGVASMPHWRQDAEAAALLAGAVRNDHV